MRTRLAVRTLMTVTTGLRAQEQQRTAFFLLSFGSRQACITAVEGAKAFQLLAGMIVTGGNPVLGTAGSLGGGGHIALTTRVNLVKASLPTPDSASQPSVPSSFDGAIPAPMVEGAVGIVRGLSGGVLGLDILGSAVLVPTGLASQLSVDSGATHIGSVALGLGYGARVGLLRGAFPVPSLSVSFMHRTLPRLRYGAADGNPFEFDADLRADAYRVEAGWRFVLVDVAAGFGVDHYVSRMHASGRNPTESWNLAPFEASNTRQVLFLNGGLRLATAMLVAELGYQTGKDQHLSTNFSDFDPKAGHVFGGIGIRFGL